MAVRLRSIERVARRGGDAPLFLPWKIQLPRLQQEDGVMNKNLLSILSGSNPLTPDTSGSRRQFLGRSGQSVRQAQRLV